MQRFFKSIIISSLLIFGFFSFVPNAHAAPTEIDVYGYAWSDNIGWISMNCNNSSMAVGYNQNTCPNADYKVTLNVDDGTMKGYGWADSVGWILFNPRISTPGLSGNLSGPVVVRNPAGPGVQPVTGWARFCSDSSSSVPTNPDQCLSGLSTITVQNGGWNGWVAMSGKSQAGNLFEVSYNTDTGGFSGFAWGGTLNDTGSEVVGWINFNLVTTGTKINLGYIPTILLSTTNVPALNPTPPPPTVINPGEWVDLNFKWTNPSSLPEHKFVSCTAYAEVGGTLQQVINWDSSTFDLSNPRHLNLPTFPMPSGGHPQDVMMPNTTYFLDCVNNDGSGVHAADHLNPNVPCNASSLATLKATCPKSEVIVKQDPNSSVTLEGKIDGSNDSTYSDNFSVAPNEKITLRWTSPLSSWSNCRANVPSNTTVVPEWTSSGGIIKNAPNSTQVGVSVPQNTSTYILTCTRSGVEYTSNIVTVNKSAVGSANLVLVAKLDDDPQTTWPDPDPDGAYDSYITVPSNRNVILHWESSSVILPGSCSASSVPSTNWTGAQIDPDNQGSIVNAVKTNVTLNRAANALTTYTITCTASVGLGLTQTVFSSAVVLALAPTTPSVSISGCAVDEQTPFTLKITATNLQNLTCERSNGAGAVDSAGVATWMGTYVTSSTSPDVNQDISDMYINGPTTFTVKCGPVPVATDTITIDLDPTCNNSNSNRNWFFRFFER